jgi:hypothetical protein
MRCEFLVEHLLVDMIWGVFECIFAEKGVQIMRLVKEKFLNGNKLGAECGMGSGEHGKGEKKLLLPE